MKTGGYFAAITLACLLTAHPALADAVGNIISLKGDGVITRDGEEMAIQLNAPVHAMDVIETEKDGIAVIQFIDRSMLTVGSTSSVTIDQYVYDPNAKDNSNAVIGVGKGFFQFVSGKMKGDRLKIKTPISTIGIRGTEFYGEVRSDGTTLVGLVECCVELRSHKGGVMLRRPGTYSEVRKADELPDDPILAPEYWVNEASVALGMSAAALGHVKPEEQDSDGNPVRFNRKSFPFID